MKFLEKLHPKAQPAFLKLREKSYMTLFSQFDFSPKLFMQKTVTIYSAATQKLSLFRMQYFLFAERT